MEEIVVFGAGGHARVVIDTLERTGKFRIRGLIAQASTPSTAGIAYPLLGTDAVLKEIGVNAGVIAIADNWIRMRLASAIRSDFPSFRFISAIHPSAIIARDVHIGDGTVVMAGVCINSGTHVDEHCIVNTRSSLDHENWLEKGCSVAPGVVTGGNVRLGELSVLGLSSSVIQGIRIGTNTLVGAGAVVVNDLPPDVVAWGVPCRPVRARMKGDPCL